MTPRHLSRNGYRERFRILIQAFRHSYLWDIGNVRKDGQSQRFRIKIAAYLGSSLFAFLTIAIPLPAQTSEARQSAGVAGATKVTGFTLPLPELTPGLTRDLTLAQICTTKWGLDHRFVTHTMEEQVCKAYNLTDAYCFGHTADPKTGKPHPNVEWDHLVPREDAGADDVRNLWAQPWLEAMVKDRVENWTHTKICAMQPEKAIAYLAYVQAEFESDWRVLYRLYLADRAAHPSRAPIPKSVPVPRQDPLYKGPVRAGRFVRIMSVSP
jgi:hypothetical protein